MIQLNLLPDVKKEFIKAQRTKRTIIMIAAIASGASIAIVVILFMSVYVVQKQTLNGLNEEVAQDISNLQGIEDLDKILTIQNQLAALPGLHEDKPQAQRAFNYLTTVTPLTVELTEYAISYDEDGESGGIIEISGNAEDFKAVNTFVDSLKFAEYKAYEEFKSDSQDNEVSAEGKAFSEVVISSQSKDSTPQQGELPVSFTLTLSFSSDIFDYNFEKIELTVPNIASNVSAQERPGGNDEENQDSQNNQDPFGEGGSQ